MAEVKTLHDAFLHEMADVYDAEHQFVQAMQEMMGMATNMEVKQGLQQHLEQTKQQVKNLERAFESLDEKPKRQSCKGAAGLINEFKSGSKDIKPHELLDGFIVAAGAKSEHYEIATYRVLVEKASSMGHKDAHRLLQENLRMEEQFAQQLEQLDKRLGQQIIKQKPELVGHEVRSR